MSELLIIIILGLVQGASEFLPISSSGHLVLFYNIFGIKENTVLLSVVLHIATLIAVFICYRKTLWYMIRHPFCNTNKKLLVATIPTVILALLLNNLVEKTFGNNFIIIGFLITAILLLISQSINNRHKLTPSKYFLSKNTTSSVTSRDMTDLDINYKQAVLIGIAQGLAVFPGISRSGSTIATSLIVGVNKTDAADFSFLLSIPVILGGLLQELIKFFKGNTAIGYSALSISTGCLCAFISGLFCIKLMLKMVKRQNLSWFSFYLALLSLVLVINQYFHFLY